MNNNAINVLPVMLMLGGALQPGLAWSGDLKDRLVESIKQSVEYRKAESEQNAVNKTGEVATSAASKVLNPLDQKVSETADQASAAITVAATGPATAVTVEALQAGLDAGDLDLTGAFGAGSAKLRSKAAKLLRALAETAALRTEPLLIEGHYTATEPASLAQERAQIVKDLFVKQGVSAQQVFAAGARMPLPADADQTATLSVRAMQ